MKTRRRRKNIKSNRNTKRKSRSRYSRRKGGGKSIKKSGKDLALAKAMTRARALARARAMAKARNSTTKKAKPRKAKVNKTDPFGLQGKQVCHKKNYLFDNVYASSNYYVYKICPSDRMGNCDKILAKVYKYDPKSWHSKGDITREVKYMKLASNLRVSPGYIGYNWCNYDGDKYAIILMEKYGEGSLTKLYKTFEYKKNKLKIDKAIKEILDTLYDKNIDQNDIHSDNFLYHYNTDTGEYEFKIIDFDAAKPLGDSYRNYNIEILTKPKQYLDLSYITN